MNIITIITKLVEWFNTTMILSGEEMVFMEMLKIQ